MDKEEINSIVNASKTKKSVATKKITWNGLPIKTVTRCASIKRHACVSALHGKMYLTAGVLISMISESASQETERSGILSLKSARKKRYVRKKHALADME